MPVKHPLPTAPMAGPGPELNALRAELRCILQHPAFTPVRRQQAERLMSQCFKLGQLSQWLALAVAEAGRWEDQALATEGAYAS